jgi:hypothetical protein
MNTSMTTTQERINDLYARRQALLNDTDSELATFHNERRMAILREMKEELDRLECIKKARERDADEADGSNKRNANSGNGLPEYISQPRST